MCFSPDASFALSAVLGAIGVTSIASNNVPAQRMFAATPLLFAAQQAAEGTVWLTMNSGADGTLHRWAVSSFLAVALIVWPLWLPFSLQRIEKDVTRRRVLQGLLVVGCCVAAVCTWRIAFDHPMALMAGHSLRYDFAGSNGSSSGGTSASGSVLSLIAYVLPTIAPLFVSTTPLTRRIGIFLVFSLIAAIFVQRDALTSVWCFFAAILSGMILLAVRHARSVEYKGAMA